MELKNVEKISKALGDINRLKILFDMSSKGGLVQCSEIAQVLELAQPSISHHVKTLSEAGLIAPEKSGRKHSYVLNRSLLNDFIQHLGRLSA